MLSVIIISFNEEKNLPQLLSAIRNQSCLNYEVIVADNHSIDATRQIAHNYGALVVDGGLPGAARNRGAEAAKGDILLFLDADVDLPNEFFLRDIVAEFCEKDFGVATCSIHPVSDRKVDLFGHQAYNLFVQTTASFEPYAPGSCIIAKKSVHEAISGYNEKITFAEDSDYVKRGAKVSKFGFLKSVKILVSVRRLDRDGRFNIFIKYIMGGIYMKLHGPIENNIFNYTFGHKK
jgi:glycosyltransferase involved in cell wall biosynthesis